MASPPHAKLSRIVENRILILRGQKVMLSTDLAELYGVEPRVLVQAVKRNLDRFPKDFMFQLSADEFAHLKSQIVISSWGGARRARPYAFTEQGVAMLSSVLRSKQAVHVNIAIMRACGSDSAAAFRAHEIQFHDEAFRAASSTDGLPQ